MAVCPSCGSSRVRSGYKPVPFPLRMFGVRELLCDSCNYLYRAFSPLPPKKPHRHHHHRKADVFAAGGSVDLQTLKKPPTNAPNPVPEATTHPPIELPPSVDPAASAHARSRHAAHTCPQCGSDNTKRRRRRVWERIVFALSDKRAYICHDCDASFYDRHHHD
ncbi:MAG: hypothetical protein KF868_09140 [Acidobacteria bacterium]|nr:hypothetical protein [Acidobacteriota bacterium]MCW5968329.1 hypothetical protein [Blastocatellales bacterium]